MEKSFSKVLVIPTIFDETDNSKKILLLKENGETKPIQEKIRKSDPSCIYTAVRCFLLEVLDIKFNPADSILQRKKYDEIFNYWLGKMSDASFYECIEDKTYFFVLNMGDQLDKTKRKNLLIVGEEEFKVRCPHAFDMYCHIREFYDELEKTQEKGFYGIFNCQPTQEWRNHCKALYLGSFRQNGEIWKDYFIPEFQFPSKDELSKLKGLVISGANHAAYDESIEFNKHLSLFLKKIHDEFPHIKLLGVCFGCQMLAHSLGGKAAKMSSFENSFLLNLEKISLTSGFKEKKFFTKSINEFELKELEHFIAIEAHGDHVEILPENAEIFASSNSTKIEMWGIGDKILGVQFHPEFNEEFLKGRIVADIEDLKLPVSVLQRFEESEKVHKLDRTFQIQLCKNFLKYE